MAFVVHYVSILRDDERINYVRTIFCRSHIYIGEHVLKHFGNTFNMDVVVSGSNKLKTSIFNLEILSAKIFFTYFFVFMALKISTKYR